MAPSFDPNTGLEVVASPSPLDPNAHTEAFRPDASGGFLASLPKPELLPAPTIPAGPNQVIVVPMPAAPTPGTAPTNEQEFLQRVSNAFNRLNIDPNQVKVGILHQLEAAGAAYEAATVGNDKNFWQAQGVRLAAALHSLFG